jgi:diguanylate cyclase (GGDEF)-like protein
MAGSHSLIKVGLAQVDSRLGDLAANLDHHLEWIEHARAERTGSALSIAMLDLDNFKSYNDTFGHQEGDELLRNVGRIMKETLRETDLVCRYAGDEFCVVVSDISADDLRTVAQKIITAIGEFPFKRKVTMSIGIAKFQEGLSKKDFINKADEALYKAKHSGKNQIIIDS